MIEIFKTFFTHKDFLPDGKAQYGTLFTPLQLIFCLIIAVLIIFLAIKCAKKSEQFMKKVFVVLWAIMVITEPLINIYDCCLGREYKVDWSSVFPLWYCSIFMYVLPFAVFGKGDFKRMACGHICTLGLAGGLINFVYPASYISYYSCISLAGFRTIFYHGAMIFTALTMLFSGYHSFKGVTKWKEVLLPAIPSLILSIPSNIVNFTLGADYMFFKMESFFLAPIGAATPDAVSVILVYVLLVLVQCLPYLPSFIANNKRQNSQKS